jgi:acetoin utilization protein AcuB
MIALAQVMSTDLVAVDHHTPLGEAAQQLLAAHVRQVVVLDADGHVLGLAHDGSIFRYGRWDGGWRPHQPAYRPLTVQAATQPAPIAPLAQSTFDDVLRSLVLSACGAVVLVDRERRPVGLLTEADALAEAHRRVPRALRVSDLAHPMPYTIGPDDALHAAWVLMSFHGFRHLPVLSAGALVGVISRRDLDEAAADTSYQGVVRERMSPATETTRPWIAAADAAEVMLRQRIGCLPVTDDGRLVALLTVTDVLRALLKADRGPRDA